MNTTYNKENLQVHLELLKPSGYTLESFENEFFYTKDESLRKITITPFYDDYFPHDVVFTGVSVSVLFYNVEQILNNLYVSNPITDFRHFLNETPTFSKGFSSALSNTEYDKLKNTKVFDDSTFYLVKPLLQQMITAAVNFVNQNQNLQDFYNFGEAMSIEELTNFYIQPLPPRRMIVKKLTNAPDFNSYAVGLIDRYFNQYNRPQMGNFLQALKNHLDNL